jgi:hypothetical protein
MPKDAAGGISGVLNLQFALACHRAAFVEDWIKEPEMASRHRNTAESLNKAVNERFWNEERGLYANDLAHTEFSEHAQCLALLANAVPNAHRMRVIDGLLHAPDLDRTTIYFSHYLFEALTLLGRTDEIITRMPLWFDHLKNGLRTTIEHPEPTRSDCHAWGAHPIYHYFASFLGIRPAGPGFTGVEIRPQPGGLKWLKGSMPTPHGMLHMNMDENHGLITLPPGLHGVLIREGNRTSLNPGENMF